MGEKKKDEAAWGISMWCKKGLMRIKYYRERIGALRRNMGAGFCVVEDMFIHALQLDYSRQEAP